MGKQQKGFLSLWIIIVILAAAVFASGVVYVANKTSAPSPLVIPVHTLVPTESETPRTFLQNTCKTTPVPDKNTQENYYVNFSLDGTKKSFLSGRQLGTLNDALKVPYGYFEHTSTHTGNYNDINIEASPAQATGEWANIFINDDSDQVCEKDYSGHFAYISSAFWYSGNCTFTILETSGSSGYIRGTGLCNKLVDAKNNNADNKTLTDLNFNVQMRGNSYPIE